MGLMGPASSVLANIPFLKPIASITGKLLMKTIHALTRTEFWEKTKMAMAKLRDKLTLKQWRMERRDKKKEKKKPMKYLYIKMITLKIYVRDHIFQILDI